jgi:hypothetical protein
MCVRVSETTSTNKIFPTRWCWCEICGERSPPSSSAPTPAAAAAGFREQEQQQQQQQQPWQWQRRWGGGGGGGSEAMIDFFISHSWYKLLLLLECCSKFYASSIDILHDISIILHQQSVERDSCIPLFNPLANFPTDFTPAPACGETFISGSSLTYAHTHARTHSRTHTHTRMHTHTHACIHICIHTSIDRFCTRACALTHPDHAHATHVIGPMMDQQSSLRLRRSRSGSSARIAGSRRSGACPCPCGMCRCTVLAGLRVCVRG